MEQFVGCAQKGPQGLGIEEETETPEEKAGLVGGTMLWNAQTLKRFRKDNKLSQGQVGVRLQVSRQMVHRVERGQRPLPAAWEYRLNDWARQHSWPGS
jgi:DNA-binding transcriptional regulator YiaG